MLPRGNGRGLARSGHVDPNETVAVLGEATAKADKVINAAEKNLC